MREKYKSFINFLAPGQFRLPGQTVGLAGRRAGASFFARHLDSFIMTRNFATIYRDWYPLDNFIVTQNLRHFTGTGKKQVTATQTAPN
jgi:hypothetical protein